MWVKDWNAVVDTATLQPNEPLNKEAFDFMEIMQQWHDSANKQD